MKGRWSFSVKKNEARLFAIVRTPDGKLHKLPVKKSASTIKKYDAYVKSLQGLYVPRSIAKYLYQPKGNVK